MSNKSPLDKYPTGTIIIPKKRAKGMKFREAYQKDERGDWYGAWGWESPVPPPESHIVVYKPGSED